MTKSVLHYLLIAMIGLLIQSSVFRDNFLGIPAPDFVLLLVLCLAQRFQNTAGVFIAFGLGLLGDFASGQFLGPFAAGSVAAYSLLVYLSDKVFAEKGFHGATTQDIAAEMGIKQGSLYYYFRSKEEALQLVCEYGFENYVQRMEKICAKSQAFEAKMLAIITS